MILLEDLDPYLRVELRPRCKDLRLELLIFESRERLALIFYFCIKSYKESLSLYKYSYLISDYFYILCLSRLTLCCLFCKWLSLSRFLLS